MLDVGWQELLLIAALAVVLIGPEELPKVMVFFGRVVRRIHYVKYALSQQFDDLMREADLDDLRKSVNFEEKDFNEAEADAEEDPPAAPQNPVMKKTEEGDA
jgi:sec-independent protein translocase protein TatB